MSPTDSESFQQMLQQLRKTYIEEMPEKLDRLDHLLVVMEESGVSDEPFNEFYRIVHSLKGSGSTFGLHIVTTICHQLEDLLNTAEGGKKFNPALIGISLNYVDLLRLSLDMVHAGQTDFTPIEERLIALRKRLAPKKFTVLVVDNSKLLSQIYRQALAKLPVQLVIMDDSLVGLRRVLTEPFDLLITTNEIPVLSGMALIGALKLSTTRNHGIKTILVTSNKKMANYVNRSTDADYVIVKDAQLAQNLVKTAQQALMPA